MKHLTLKILIFITLCNHLQAQDEHGPYKLNPWVDVPIIVGGAALAYPGFLALRDKRHLDSAEAAKLRPEDINSFDRGATRHFDAKMSDYSDYSLYTSIALAPVFIFAEKRVKKDALKVGVLYLETMAIMGNAYLWGVSAFERKRPYVYNPEVPLELKLRKGTTNSFFAGHPAAAAASTFFIAKVFNDYYPESKLRKFVWAAAIVPPALVAYFRYMDGQHFPTDIIAGIPLGAAIGILVPHLHKTSSKSKAMLYPAPGGIGMTCKF